MAYTMARRKHVHRGGKKVVRRRRENVVANKFGKALLRLKHLPKSKMPEAMNTANNAFIRQFCSSINRLKHAKLTAKHSKVLRSNKHKLRRLVSKRTSIQSKRKLLSQRGGFIATIIPLIAAAA